MKMKHGNYETDLSTLSDQQYAHECAYQRYTLIIIKCYYLHPPAIIQFMEISFGIPLSETKKFQVIARNGENLREHTGGNPKSLKSL